MSAEPEYKSAVPQMHIQGVNCFSFAQNPTMCAKCPQSVSPSHTNTHTNAQIHTHISERVCFICTGFRSLACIKAMHKRRRKIPWLQKGGNTAVKSCHYPLIKIMKVLSLHVFKHVIWNAASRTIEWDYPSIHHSFSNPLIAGRGGREVQEPIPAWSGQEAWIYPRWVASPS